MRGRSGSLPSLIACAVAVLFLAPATAHAFDDVYEPDGTCTLSKYNSITLQVNLWVEGTPVGNSSVKVHADDAKINVKKTAVGTPYCDPLAFNPQTYGFKWSVAAAPSGQTAALLNDNTLTPTVNLGGKGSYRIRLTVCPNDCKLRHKGTERKVGPLTAEVPIEAKTEAPPPPETIPFAPPRPAIQYVDPSGQSVPPVMSFPERLAKCGGPLPGGFTKPEWVTGQRFGGANDYRLAEGPVTWSRIADLDNPLTHSSQDFEWKILPDDPYRTFNQGPNEPDFKMEGEEDHIPAFFRPTADASGDVTNFVGDRLSAYGYWIIDCGHTNHLYTELHPPVGIATQRARPIQIPQTFRPPGFPNGLGSNVWVPGVVADIWFDRDSGRSGSCLNPTSLHQPEPRLPYPLDCLGNLHPINRRFTFNVYLPQSPLVRATRIGREPPPVPLFVDTQKLSGGTGGPEPTYVVKQAGDATWLQVTVDLSSFTQQTYARRMAIAWAYPSPDNWGASRWRITLDKLRVNSDADWVGDDGDWHFHFNTNNRDQEWTELFSCDDCVDDQENYNLTTRPGGPHVSTGKAGGNGSDTSHARGLGPDPVVFPGQPFLIHTVGFDPDWPDQDDIGTIEQAKQQEEKTYSDPSDIKDGSYTLDYKIGSLGSVGAANLTPEANAQLRAYSGTDAAHCGQGTPGPRVPPECIPTTSQSSVFGGKSSIRLETLPQFEDESHEGPGSHSLAEISPKGLRQEFHALKRKGRRQALKRINRSLRELPKALRGDAAAGVETLEHALPARLVRQAVPRSIRRAVKRQRREHARARRRARRRHRAHRRHHRHRRRHSHRRHRSRRH